MVLGFYKYHGTGNDFVLLDDRQETFYLDAKAIANLCSRRYGIGADGLILLRQSDACDFKMVYFNADGHEGSFCGNGSRCIVAFADHLGLVDGGRCRFEAMDGIHQGQVLGNGQIVVQMRDVGTFVQMEDGYFLDTGSPHLVKYVQDMESYPVAEEGRRLRVQAESYHPGGANINFICSNENGISIRTYERGVEAETHACGTGVTAAALIWGAEHLKRRVLVQAKGGELEVSFDRQEGIFTNIWLKGGATRVYYGHIHVSS